jgi:hypothetical protein
MKLNHPELIPLLDDLIRVTKVILDKQGVFLPHAAIVTPAGEIAWVGAKMKEQQPGAQKVLQLLESGLRSMASEGKCKAIGTAVDIRLKQAPCKEDEGKDAIWVFLEHKDSMAANVYMPYTKGLLGSYTYGEWFANYAEPKFFAKPH